MRYVGNLELTEQQRERMTSLIVYFHEWARNGGAGYQNSAGGDGAVPGTWRWVNDASLVKPAGRIYQRTIETRFDPGDRDEDNRGVRHKSLISSFRGDFNLMRRIVKRTAMAYRADVEFRGKLSRDPGFLEMRAVSNWQTSVRRNLHFALACGCGAIRSKIVPGYPPGTVVVPGHLIDAIPYPHNDMMTAIYIETRPAIEDEPYPNSVLVWDLSDVKYPRWGQWRNRSTWSADKKSGYRRALHMWSMEGPSYPWTWQGKPIMNPTVIQPDPDATCLTPTRNGMLQSTIDLLMIEMFINYCMHTGAMQKPFFLSKQFLDGMDQCGLDASAFNNLVDPSGNAIQMVVVPDSTQAVQRLWQLFIEAADRAASEINPDFQVRQTDQPKSGIALLIESSGIHQFREQQINTLKPMDRASIIAECASWNYAIDAGYWNGTRIEEMDPCELELEYPTVWFAHEKDQQREMIAADVKDGLTPVDDLVYFDMDLDPENEKDRIRVEAIVDRRAARRMDNIRMGLLTKADTVALMISRFPGGLTEDADTVDSLPADSVPGEEFIPPPDVADTASTGLTLRKQYKRGDMSLLPASKRLRNQEPHTRGQLRELNSWHAIHANDSQKESAGDGIWDPSDPSGEYIDYQMMGGDPCILWISVELANLDKPKETTDGTTEGDQQQTE